MSWLELLLVVVTGYVVLLLLLEATIWKTQPDMDGGATLHIRQVGNGQQDAMFTRRLYGFDYQDKLYVSSNHWFRRWYHAVLDNPDIEVEHEGQLKPYTAVPISGDEQALIAREYKMRFVLRLMCGFAPRRYLRLDPREADTAGQQTSEESEQ